MFDVLWLGPLRTLSGVLLQARPSMFMVRAVTRNYMFPLTVKSQDTLAVTLITADAQLTKEYRKLP